MGVWNGYGREGILVLDGVSRKSLFEEVTLTGSFKRNKNETHALLLLILGSQFISIYFTVLLSNSSHVELGSLLFHFVNFSPQGSFKPQPCLRQPPPPSSCLHSHFCQLVFSVLSLFLFIPLRCACLFACFPRFHLLLTILPFKGNLSFTR